MRSPRNKAQTWAWSEILSAVGETDAALRRKLQRGQVKLEGGADAGRTRATLWDIARLRVSRYLCDRGFDASRAFGLASLFVDSAYGALMSGREIFAARYGEKQHFKYMVASHTDVRAGGIRVVSIDPSNPGPGLTELGLIAADPRNLVVPIHALVLEAWYGLPHLTNDIAAWMRASSAKMAEMESAGQGA